jgi:hypothetical protein
MKDVGSAQQHIQNWTSEDICGMQRGEARDRGHERQRRMFMIETGPRF